MKVSLWVAATAMRRLALLSAMLSVALATSTAHAQVISNAAPLTTQACPIPHAFESGSIFAANCFTSTTQTGTITPQYGFSQTLTASANTGSGNEAVAGAFYTTALPGAPDSWALATSIQLQPGATAGQVAELNVINSNCDPGPVWSPSTRCPYNYPIAILDGIDTGAGPHASFSGSISGSTLTVSGSVTGTIAVGQSLANVGATNVALGTTIVSGSGTSWQVSIPQSVGNEAMTSAGYYPVGSAILIEGATGGTLAHCGVCLNGANSIDLAGFADLTNDARIIYGRGSHTNGIYFPDATFSGPAIDLAPTQTLAFDGNCTVSCIFFDNTKTDILGTTNSEGPLTMTGNCGATTSFSWLTTTGGAWCWNQSNGNKELDFYSQGGFSFYSLNGSGVIGVRKFGWDGNGNTLATGSLLSSATSGVGYTTGSGGTVTQLTSRTTGVTLNNPTGAITLFNAAGSATPLTFTITDSSVAATDTIVVNEKSGTNLYEVFVTAVNAGSFNVTFFTTGGTSTDAPVINFTVMKGAVS